MKVKFKLIKKNIIGQIMHYLVLKEYQKNQIYLILKEQLNYLLMEGKMNQKLIQF